MPKENLVAILDFFGMLLLYSIYNDNKDGDEEIFVDTRHFLFSIFLENHNINVTETE